jgi:hypothetical protein
VEIDRALNLVIPVQRPDGAIYVHTTPLPFAVFQRYFKVIARTFAEVHAAGLGAAAGPRVAGMMLESVAREMGVWDDPRPRDGQSADEVTPGVATGLMSEIRRLSNALVLTSTGWEVLPLQVAMDRKLFTAEEVSRVEGAVVFFMASCAMLPPEDLPATIGAVCYLQNAVSTSSTSTEYAASLTTPT